MKEKPKPPLRKARALIANNGWTLRLGSKKSREKARAILTAVGIAALDNATTELSIIPMENDLLKIALEPWFAVVDGPEVVKKLAELWRNNQSVGRPDLDAQAPPIVPLELVRQGGLHGAGGGGVAPGARRSLPRRVRP